MRSEIIPLYNLIPIRKEEFENFLNYNVEEIKRFNIVSIIVIGDGIKGYIIPINKMGEC